MILALSAMDPTVAGMLFLVAFVLFLVAALGAFRTWPFWPVLVAAGLACCALVWLWERFAAAG